MPLFIAALIGGLIQAAGTIVGRVLLSLGFGYVSYTGISASLDFAKTQVFTNLAGMSPVTIQVLGLLKVGNAVSIIASALLVRLTLMGLQSGTIKRLVMRG